VGNEYLVVLIGSAISGWLLNRRVNFSRLNKMLNEELGLHKGLFFFMNRLKTTVFESGFSVIAVANAGKQTKCRETLAAQKLSEKAAKAEREYKDGTKSAADLLRLVAVHFDDSALIDLLNDLADAEVTVDDEVQDLDLEIDSQESQESGEFQSMITV